MAVGDDAIAGGLPVVPNSGEEGKVKYGGREINRTRDFIAQVKALVLAGINNTSNYGTASPVNADGKPDGTVYFKIV